MTPTRRNCSSPSSAVTGSPPVVASASEPALAVREGDFSQGLAAEHPALEQGLGGDPEASARGRTPYQTLIASPLHKYAAGRLKEV